MAEFGTRTRFIVLILLLFCLSAVWSNILAFNFALICMQPIANATDSTANEDRHVFTEYERMVMTSVVAVAALLSNFPVVSLVTKFGVRSVFVVLGLLSAAATLAMPFAVRMGYPYLVACRFLQGIAFTGNFPVIGDFASKWTYYKQTGLFVAVLVAYVQLSPAVSMPASGALCASFGWSSVLTLSSLRERRLAMRNRTILSRTRCHRYIFFAHGLATLAFFVGLSLFYRNNPVKHPFVGEKEMSKIAVGKAAVDKKLMKKVPYGAILSTVAVWGTWLGAIGNFTAVATMFLYNPLYLSSVLGFSMQSTGMTAAVPPIIQFFVKLACGFLSDRMKFLSEAYKFRLFNSLAFGGCAAFLLALSFMGTDRKSVNVILLGGAAGILGASTGGFFKAAPFISKQYSSFVTGNLSLMLTICLLTAPILVNTLVTRATQEEWAQVFQIIAITMLICNCIFCLTVRNDPCDWTTADYITRNSVKDAHRVSASKQEFEMGKDETISERSPQYAVQCA